MLNKIYSFFEIEIRETCSRLNGNVTCDNYFCLDKFLRTTEVVYLSGVICRLDWAETVLPALPAADGTIVGKACAVTMELVEL